jgi:hypothetical protein
VAVFVLREKYSKFGEDLLMIEGFGVVGREKHHLLSLETLLFILFETEMIEFLDVANQMLAFEIAVELEEQPSLRKVAIETNDHLVTDMAQQID